MNSLIQILKEKNLLGKKGLKYSNIESLKLREIVDIAIEITENIESNQKPVKNELFSHAASLSLGGSSLECSYIDCRIENIRNLSRFAVMYSDKVIIENYFNRYTDIGSNNDLGLIKQRFAEDLAVINEITPFLEKGFIELFSPDMSTCFACQAKKFLGDNAARNLERTRNKLKSDFLNGMSVQAELGPEGGIDFTCMGLPPYFDHEKVICFYDVPDALINRPSILKKIENGKTVSLSKALIRDLKLNDEYAHQVVMNSIFGLSASSCLNATFLTENDLHIKFLNSLNSNYEISRRNLIAEKYLTTMVPFLEEVELKNILKIRNREQEAFLLFRQALNKSIDEFRSFPERFTEKDARSIYDDIIAPSLAQLDAKVNKSKKDLISKPFRSFIGIVGVISFGLLTGLVPPNTSEIVQALGLLKYGSDLIKDSMALGDAEKDIKNDHYYFLWKVKKTAKHSHWLGH